MKRDVTTWMCHLHFGRAWQGAPVAHQENAPSSIPEGSHPRSRKSAEGSPTRVCLGHFALYSVDCFYTSIRKGHVQAICCMEIRPRILEQRRNTVNRQISRLHVSRAH